MAAFITGRNMPESTFDFTRNTQSMYSFLPTTMPCRQPAIEWLFDIELNSRQTSFAPSTCMIDKGWSLRMNE